MSVRFATSLSLLTLAFALGGCATVLDMSGKATTWSGNVMADTGKKLDAGKTDEQKQGTTAGGLLQGFGAFQAKVGNLVRDFAGKKTDNTPASDGKLSGK